MDVLVLSGSMVCAMQVYRVVWHVQVVDGWMDGWLGKVCEICECEGVSRLVQYSE